MQTEPEQIFREFLESKRLKFTKQRQEILGYLLKTDKHATAEQIYRDLNKRDASLGRATVFRTLNLLEGSGFVDKIFYPDGRQGYEHKFSRPHHDHLICVECSDVVEFSNPTIERLQDKIAKGYDFDLLWHRHEMFGKCRKCRKAKP